MSLIRVRKNRKKNWLDVRRGGSPGKLIVGFAVVVFLIWYLSSRI